MLITDEVKSHLFSNYTGEIKDVIFFCSQAQDKNHLYSDYDFLVILKSDYSIHDENEIQSLENKQSAHSKALKTEYTNE